jgi:hypothetical protein
MFFSTHPSPWGNISPHSKPVKSGTSRRGHEITEAWGLLSWPFSALVSLNHNVGVSTNGGTPIAGWFILANPIKMDDLGVLPFRQPPCLSVSINYWHKS